MGKVSDYTLSVSLFKSASTVSLLTLVSRITGLLRELLIAATFGASAITDAFNVAFRIPNLFRRLFAEGAFSQAFVPVLATSLAQQGEEATKRLVGRVATVLIWVLVLTCVLGVLASPLLVWVMASGLQQNPHSFDLAVTLTRWMFPYIAFMSLVALAAGVLNTHKRFAVAAATPVLLNLAIIAAAWFGAPELQARGLEPIYSLGAGVMLGGMMQLTVQLWALGKLGFMPRLDLSWQAVKEAWRDGGTQNVIQLMAPALLGVGVAHISILINTQIASYLSPGSVSWLSYADRLMEFPTALLGVALGVVLTPQLAAAKAANDSEKYSAMLDWGLRMVVFLTLPCAVALLVFTQPLVAVLYHYGAFSARDVLQTSAALTGYGVGLLGLVAIKVLAPGFYASQDIRTPVRIAVAVLLLTQLLNLALVPWLAHAGLALAVGIGALINALWLLIGLLRRGSYQPAPGWRRFLLQVGLASALLAVFLAWAGGAVSWVVLRSDSLQRVGLLVLVLAISALIYFGSAMVLGLKLRHFIRR